MTAGSVRLHITPLNPDLLHAVVGHNLLKSAANISFHTIQTFPENNYGYLDLPTMEAEKIKKKLNGAILKGKKIKVEEARPKKRRRVEEPADEPAQEAAATRPKKSKKERNVISGNELPSDRKVKRGWTDADPGKSSKKSKDKTSSTASKYSEKDELLFRTKVPPNKADAIETTKKDKTRSKKTSGEHVVHEFAKSTQQPSFLRQDVGLGIKANLTYVEGKGWVDEAGEVVEPEKKRVLRQREANQTAANAKRKEKGAQQKSPSTSSSSSEGEDTDGSMNQCVPHVPENDDETSSSGSSTSSESGGESDANVSDKEKAYSASASDRETSGPPGVHPLEALFKKPKKAASQDVAKPSLELSTSFSFFSSENPDDIDDEQNIPGTPYSSQEVRSRGLRSAAPRPDTPHPGRFNS